MYLKSIEIIGFKSFADRTVMNFEQGMTSIVGPNGCGKSNVSDAIRWVLGEQSAKALRGSKMEDIIFNGTDKRKPLNVAEVSLTLAECESALSTEYNEVRVTRRVLRSGEGQYFINKAGCRLKDIQRLFMDTGIGTNSYSLMEQGRIDLILSSRPDDRRAVFEEASGITKFKSDKKEALRKLDQTEANLLRLDDIIREVKRQIGSLQRQAGKARRYKEMQTKLRSLDIFVTRDRLSSMEEKTTTLETQQASLNERDEAHREHVAEMEKQTERARNEIRNLDNLIGEAMEAHVQAKTEFERAEELISVNEDRVQELQGLAERDSRETEHAQGRLDANKKTLEDLLSELSALKNRRDEAKTAFDTSLAELRQIEENVEKDRKALQQLRDEAVVSESKHAKLQNELSEIDARERNTVIQREKLAAEKNELTHGVEQYDKRKTAMESQLTELSEKAEHCQQHVLELTTNKKEKATRIQEAQSNISELKSITAARKGQLDILKKSHEDAEGFPAGARQLLQPDNGVPIAPEANFGAFIEQLVVPGEYQTALEAVIQHWMDAVVVQSPNEARNVIEFFEGRHDGVIKLLCVEGEAPSPLATSNAGTPFMDVVEYPNTVRPLVERMLAPVRIVEQFNEVPNPIPQGTTFVTSQGAILRADGSAECWSRDAQNISPLARKQMMDDIQADIEQQQKQRDELTATLSQLENEEISVEDAITQARQGWQDAQHKHAVREGELQIVSQETKTAKDRLETVSWELKTLNEQHADSDANREAVHEELEAIRNRQAEVRSQIEITTDELRTHEQDRNAAHHDMTEKRVLFAQEDKELESRAHREAELKEHIADLESAISERSQGLTSYSTRIETLQAAVTTTRTQLQPLKDSIVDKEASLSEARQKRDEASKTLLENETGLREIRLQVDQVAKARSSVEVELAELRIRHQNQIDRIAGEYHLSAEDVMKEADPEWENEETPDMEELETNIAELRTKLDSMGPVNLVAIEEHKELEERFAFLTEQQDDLVQSKQNLLDMIKKINETTTDMFADTFNKVNDNFQAMFKQLFGGGTAKLVLVDEENILDSGIEIIARPPGKKLQTVSLLSGGERTMTAVALLFSLYQVKPSPFCVLDELDAALDDSNIERFVQMLNGFLEGSQFIVISHNRQTIEASECLYGVTMEERGVSKIVSVKISEHERDSKSADQTPELART